MNVEDYMIFDQVDLLYYFLLQTSMQNLLIQFLKVKTFFWFILCSELRIFNDLDGTCIIFHPVDEVILNMIYKYFSSLFTHFGYLSFLLL